MSTLFIYYILNLCFTQVLYSQKKSLETCLNQGFSVVGLRSLWQITNKGTYGDMSKMPTTQLFIQKVLNYTKVLDNTKIYFNTLVLKKPRPSQAGPNSLQ